MADWVRICSVVEGPQTDEVTKVEIAGTAVCLANVGGKFHALDNLCPHRQGPLGQGWVEGKAVICPWHAWAFDVTTGVAAEPERAQVRVYPVREEGGDLLMDLT